MSITVEDKKLKIRLAKYGPSELFGAFDTRTKMDDEQLIQCFDNVWNQNLRDITNQAVACDSIQAYILLTDTEKKFFDPDQEHRLIRLQDEGLNFIAQIETTSTTDEGLLTQLWKVESFDNNLYSKLLKKQKEAQKWSETYYDLGANYKKRLLWVGGIATVLTIITGSSVFADLLGSFNYGSRIVGALTLIAGALTALQTFLNLGAESTKFEAAGKGWGKLARKIDLKILAITSIDTKDTRILKDVIEEMNELEDFSPTLSSSIYKKAKTELETESKSSM